jgi:predicted DCC family thiol-disulfide oxidoreductase YuxK
MNIVLFDGICNLCNSTVSFLIKYDKHNQLHFAAQQTPSGKNLMQQYHVQQAHNSVILIKGDTVFYKSDAIIEITKLITGWPRIFQYTDILPKWFRNTVYDFIAKNRYRIFGKKLECSIPPEATSKRFL